MNPPNSKHKYAETIYAHCEEYHNDPSRTCKHRAENLDRKKLPQNYLYVWPLPLIAYVRVVGFCFLNG